MDKRVLLIGNEHEFLMKSIKQEMIRRGYDVVCTLPKIDLVNRNGEGIKVYLLFVETADSIRDLLVYLKDTAYDKRIQIGIVGEKADVQDAIRYLMQDNVAMSFERPVDSKAISAGLEELYEVSRKENVRKSILVIDDDPTFLRRTQDLLKNTYKVYPVNSGTAAIMLLTKHKVDLILLDYEMPVVSGPQVYEMIKAEPELAGIPIMFLTAKSDIYSVTQAGMLKPEKYLLKTMPVKELMDALTEHFRQTEMRDIPW